MLASASLLGIGSEGPEGGTGGTVTSWPTGGADVGGASASPMLFFCFLRAATVVLESVSVYREPLVVVLTRLISACLSLSALVLPFLGPEYHLRHPEQALRSRTHLHHCNNCQKDRLQEGIHTPIIVLHPGELRLRLLSSSSRCPLARRRGTGPIRRRGGRRSLRRGRTSSQRRVVRVTRRRWSV